MFSLVPQNSLSGIFKHSNVKPKLEGKIKLKQNILGGGATFKRTAFS